MKNPAEELVTAWLQECGGYFTRNNIKVPKKKGGMGAEIDILATDRKKNIWIEVSVSSNPRCNYRKDIRFQSTLKDFLSDFVREDKNRKVREIFNGKPYERWLVYGKLPLVKKEKDSFSAEMKKKKVKAVYFGDILKDLLKLKGYRLDAARGYLNIIKAFWNE